jgi:hypothetical protein
MAPPLMYMLIKINMTLCNGAIISLFGRKLKMFIYLLSALHIAKKKE